MKPSIRRLSYGVLVLFCVVFAAFILVKGKDKSIFPELRERTGALAAASEWPTTKIRINLLIDQLKKKPTDAKINLVLAKELMQEGRASGDFSYYNKAALDLIRGVLVRNPKDFEAKCLESMIYLSQHRFAEGKEVADRAQKENPFNSFVYGLLVDANVELGDYPKAVEMADKMAAVRPDIRSYSRVSYLREIHGDPKGAKEAIQLALDAGVAGTEETEWARMVQGHLYEETGHLDTAEMIYKTSLQNRPDYPFALAGLGRVARFRKDYPTAISYLEKAKSVMPDAAFLDELIDLYQLSGQPEKAEKMLEITLDAMISDNISAGKNKDEGHYSDSELALLYLKKRDFDCALTHARTEYARRPQNIDACETLAWVLFKKGQFAEAAPLIKNAIRTGSKQPERLVKAGFILAANGQTAEGEALKKQGLALKPFMDEIAAELKN
jgi:tetratricopeptide (TPR) repeat protein